jgi:hypothetical protein
LFLLFHLRYIFYQRNEKQNLWSTLNSHQTLEETRNKKCLFPTTAKETTSGQSNLIGTTAEERRIATKEFPKKDDECDYRFLNY